MLTAEPHNGQAEGCPLTHRQCLTVGGQDAARHGAAGRPWVQVRRFHRSGPYVLCGQLIELASARDGVELFKVETIDGPLWVTGRNGRMCSGDGRCTCEPAADRKDAPC